MHDALGGRVRAMRRSERVVDVHVRQIRQRLREVRIVGFFLRMEPQVLEQDRRRSGCRGHDVCRRRTDAVGRERHRTVEELRQVFRHRLQAELRLRLALRPAEMRGEDHRGALLERVGDRRQRRAYPRVVGDARAVERHVEVDANEHAPPLEGEVTNRAQSHDYSPFFAM